MIAHILTNIGTPEAPTPAAVKPYLTEFLTDPDVIPLPWLFRQILVRGMIVPRRSVASAEKYALIWSGQGSPLLVHARALQSELQKRLPGPVLLGMQYGSPSMESAFAEAKAKGATRIQLVPLYPQYSEATTGSAVKKARALAKKSGLPLDIFPHFPVADYFIRPLASAIRSRRKGEHVLFTFHGLPEKLVKKVAGCELSPVCCHRRPLPLCYRAQSFATARALAADLGLGAEEWSVSFQSRLGRAKWMGPYTEDVLAAMPGRGIKNVLVVSPSFVSDCLETLEELGHQGRHTFTRAGGETYELVPCVNGNADFAKGLAEAMDAN
jgi:ferrochelatase